MPDFTPVDSWDEALELMDKNRRAADQATEKWQWEDINPGTYVVRMAYGFPIFSEILEDYCEPNMQGCVFGKHYSIACPLGEKGDVHRSQILEVITKEQFEHAKSLHWDVEIWRK